MHMYMCVWVCVCASECLFFFRKAPSLHDFHLMLACRAVLYDQCFASTVRVISSRRVCVFLCGWLGGWVCLCLEGNPASACTEAGRSLSSGPYAVGIKLHGHPAISLLSPAGDYRG